MNRAEAIFAAIDYLFHIPQNYINIDGITIQRNLPYGSNPAQMFDIYYKKSENPLPVLINIHGGGFVKGDKVHRSSISQIYANRGWFVINVNYRLAPKYPFPSHIKDMFTVLGLLPEMAKKYNLDLNRLVFTGDSSGAYTAAYMEAALVNIDLRAKLGLSDREVKPSAILLYCGIYDVVKALSKKIPFGITRSVAESIMGVKLKNDLSDVNEQFEFASEISPFAFVTSDWCPTCLTYSEKDFFCGGQGEQLYAKLKECGVPTWETHSTSFIDNHCYHFNFWTKTSKKTMDFTLDFLDKVRDGKL